MKYFFAIEEELLQRIWMHDPSLVVPFSRPFCPSQLNACCMDIELNGNTITLLPQTEDQDLAAMAQLGLPGISDTKNQQR